jgi:hypothetical protein
MDLFGFGSDFPRYASEPVVSHRAKRLSEWFSMAEKDKNEKALTDDPMLTLQLIDSAPSAPLGAFPEFLPV